MSTKNNLKFSKKLSEIAHSFARIPGVKKGLEVFYRPVQRKLSKKRRASFLQNGLELLTQFHRCCEENGIKYTLAFGSLLGAVREKGFIQHDLDIDVWIWADNRPDNIEAILLQYGFALDHSFMIDDGMSGREETYIYKDVTIDLFYIYPAVEKLPYCCFFVPEGDAVTCQQSMKRYGFVAPRRIELPFGHDRMLVQFYTSELYIPSNYEELLKRRYGEDYMIPNPHWTNKNKPSIVEWTEKRAIYKKF